MGNSEYIQRLRDEEREFLAGRRDFSWARRRENAKGMRDAEREAARRDLTPEEQMLEMMRDYRKRREQSVQERRNTYLERMKAVVNDIQVYIFPKKIHAADTPVAEWRRIPMVFFDDTNRYLSGALAEYFGSDFVEGIPGQEDTCLEKYESLMEDYGRQALESTAVFTGGRPESYRLCFDGTRILPNDLQGTASYEAVRVNQVAFATFVADCAERQDVFNRRIGWLEPNEGQLAFRSAFYIEISKECDEVRFGSSLYDDMYVYRPSDDVMNPVVLEQLRGGESCGMTLVKADEALEFISKFLFSEVNIKRATLELKAADLHASQLKSVKEDFARRRGVSPRERRKMATSRDVEQIRGPKL